METANRAAPRRRSLRRDELRGQLLDTVGRMLEAGTPYSLVTVDELVAEVEISRSLFYTYFEDKADLVLGRFLEIADAVHAAARAWWSLEAPLTKPELRAAMTQIYQAYRPHLRVMIAAHELAATNARFAEIVGRETQRSIDELCEYIERGQRAGFIDSSLSAPETAGWLWMSEPGFLQLARTAGTSAKARRDAIDCVTDLVWNVLYRPVAGG
jgi:AcrR family transcriptional regulator